MSNFPFFKMSVRFTNRDEVAQKHVIVCEHDSLPEDAKSEHLTDDFIFLYGLTRIEAIQLINAPLAATDWVIIGVYDYVSGDNLLEVAHMQTVKQYLHTEVNKMTQVINDTLLNAGNNCLDSQRLCLINALQNFEYICSRISIKDIRGDLSFITKTANHVDDFSVIDPDTHLPVEVSVYKDKESGGILAVDTSYLLTLSDDDPVFNPFNGNEIMLIETVQKSLFLNNQYRIVKKHLVKLIDDRATDVFFETRLLTNKASRQFIEWFEKMIGTRCDVSQHGNENYVVMCLDINESERELCQNFENNLFDGNSIEELAWHEALKMVMSEIPDIDTPVDVMMSQEIEKLPDGFVVWEPFENWDLMGIQGLVEEFKNSLMAHSKQVLKLAGVDHV